MAANRCVVEYWLMGPIYVPRNGLDLSFTFQNSERFFATLPQLLIPKIITSSLSLFFPEWKSQWTNGVTGIYPIHWLNHIEEKVKNGTECRLWPVDDDAYDDMISNMKKKSIWFELFIFIHWMYLPCDNEQMGGCTSGYGALPGACVVYHRGIYIQLCRCSMSVVI